MPVDIDGLSLEELMQLNHRVVERIKMLRAMQARDELVKNAQGEWQVGQ